MRLSIQETQTRSETVCLAYALVPGMDIGSRTYQRAVQLLTNPKHVRLDTTSESSMCFSSSVSLITDFLFLVYAITKELEPLAIKHQELLHTYARSCDNTVVQTGLLMTSSELVSASHALEAAARHYESLAKQQEALYAILKPAKV